MKNLTNNIIKTESRKAAIRFPKRLFVFSFAILSAMLFLVLMTSEKIGDSSRTISRNGKETSLITDMSANIIAHSAKIYKGRIYITWSGNVRENGYYFIERCGNGNDTRYVGMVRVNAKNNNILCSFIGKNASGGNFKYRIKFIGDDNLYSESNVITPEEMIEFIGKDI